MIASDSFAEPADVRDYLDDITAYQSKKARKSAGLSKNYEARSEDEISCFDQQHVSVQ